MVEKKQPAKKGKPRPATGAHADRGSGKKLQESEKLYRSLIECSSDAIFCVDTNGEYKFTNQLFATTFGKTPDYFVGKTFWDIYPKEHADYRFEATKRIFQTGQSESLEVEVPLPDRTLYFYATANPIKDETGKVILSLTHAVDITERKRIEQALRESEERYRNLVERALEAIIVIQDGLVKYANPNAYEIMGYPREYKEPRQFMDFIHPDDREMVIDRHLRRLKGETFSAVYPIRLVSNRGDDIWVRISTTTINWEGRPATLTFLSDIMENKRAERVTEIQRDLGISLSQADSLNMALPYCLEAAIEISGMDCGGIYLVDPDTGDLRLAHSTGLSREFMDGAALFPKESANARLALAGKPLYTKYEDFNIAITETRRAEGLKAAALIPVSSGKRVIACLNIASHTVEDILPGYRNAIETVASQIGGAVDRIQAREELAASEEKYRQLVENASDVIWNMTPDMVFTFVSSSVFQQCGYNPCEVVGRPLWDFLTATGKLQVLEEAKKYGAAAPARWEVAHYSFEQICKNGSLIRTEAVANPVYDITGKHMGFRGITRDVTNRRRLEEEQQRVQKLESVGVLAGGIAHDFNNILTSILGNISLARMETEPGSEIYNSLELAEKASVQAKELTKQLLTFSKGGAPVKKLASLVDLLKDTAGFALRGSNVKCSFSIPGDLWHAEIDAGQVSQVIQNLVINAQQAMPSGGTIELVAENMSLSETQSLGRALPLKKGNYIRISVTDHGSGIAVEHLDKVFDPFFTTKKKGSGLGLATSFSIARQHGGYLSVESQAGQGSAFYLYLPASILTAKFKQDEKELVKPVHGARILVMDDEKGVREVAGRMLEQIGYKDTGFAADGAEAIRSYQAAMESGNRFNAVILDLTIPGGMGGKETVKELLKVDPGVKAIVSSGYTDQSVMAEYKEYGFSGMVAKPYTLGELGKALSDVIG